MSYPVGNKKLHSLFVSRSPADHSALRFANSITRPHFSILLAITVSNTGRTACTILSYNLRINALE
jgi:hypothetical protein